MARTTRESRVAQVEDEVKEFRYELDGTNQQLLTTDQHLATIEKHLESLLLHVAQQSPKATVSGCNTPRTSGYGDLVPDDYDRGIDAYGSMTRGSTSAIGAPSL
ncbi:hypothetical protein PanWU01x14_235890 [Parasponia andersonii]|uniref:Uncharacterized protein n=1 Tax=Parasponia andersonii TaxID=3476 RepID=A0A2P5BIJ8_PARAD|nr:hypothetical protein PanWU01x14_235890 [Parasponia andersonii]